jgi:hypothetical protein
MREPALCTRACLSDNRNKFLSFSLCLLSSHLTVANNLSYSSSLHGLGNNVSDLNSSFFVCHIGIDYFALSHFSDSL